MRVRNLAKRSCLSSLGERLVGTAGEQRFVLALVVRRAGRLLSDAPARDAVPRIGSRALNRTGGLVLAVTGGKRARNIRHSHRLLRAAQRSCRLTPWARDASHASRIRFVAAIIPVSFVGGDAGQYRVVRMQTVVGEPLAPVARVASHPKHVTARDEPGSAWILRGTSTHVRYVQHDELERLRAVQPGLGRPECTHAALIPIRKRDDWWDLPQDERRAIFEERSRHIAATLKYLPAIARRLHHGRELGEPFDFLTWFEYAPEHAELFEELVQTLRRTEEWQYVDREVDIRLVK